MKKLTHTLALSTILLGTLSPTGQAIAGTVLASTENSTLSDTGHSSTSVDRLIAMSDSSKSSESVSESSSSEETSPSSTKEINAITNTNLPVKSTTEQSIEALSISNDKGNDSAAINGDQIMIPDLTIRELINSKIGHSSDWETYMPTISEIGTIKGTFSFDSTGTGKNISSLEGVQYLTGISELTSNNIDFPLSEMNKIGELTQLTYISLGQSNIEDISFALPLINSGNLTGLVFPHNSIKDVSSTLSYFNQSNRKQYNFLTQTPSTTLTVSSGTSIIPPDTLIGMDGSPVTILGIASGTSPEITYDSTSGKFIGTNLVSGNTYQVKYNFKDLSNNSSGAFSGTDTITVTVLPTIGGDVTLHYVDQDGAPIVGQEDVTLNGFNEGDTIPFSDNTPTIPGYSLDTANQPDPTLTFTNTPQTFNIPYTRNQGTAVNVRYVDEKGQKIAEPAQITGFENEIKQTAPYKIDIPGYTLDENKLPVSEVTLSASAQPDVVFTYTQNPGSITVKYEDFQGNKLADPKTIEGTVGSDFKVKDYEIDIPGYILREVPNDTTFKSDPQTLTYKYFKDPSDLIVHDSTIYVGDSWGPADNFTSVTDIAGNVGTTWTGKDITVDSSQLDTTKVGRYPVTYSYTNENERVITKTIYVNVVDKSAITVHDSTLTVGDSWTAKDNFDSALNKKGDKVPFDAITVDGTVDTSKAGVYKVTYSYKETTGEVELFDAQVGDTQHGKNSVIATITVKDKAPVDPGNPTEPTNPTNPSTPINPSNPTSPSSPNSPSQTGNGQGNGKNSINQTAVSSNESLPQTGEKAGLNLVATGAALLMALIGLLLFRKPKKSSDE